MLLSLAFLVLLFRLKIHKDLLTGAASKLVFFLSNPDLLVLQLLCLFVFFLKHKEARRSVIKANKYYWGT